MRRAPESDDAAVVEAARDCGHARRLTARLARLEEASSASRSDLDALKRSVEQIAAAVSPGTTGSDSQLVGYAA